jgi:ADP-ribose pyrophosphatase YjhB (NUDIX family)
MEKFMKKEKVLFHATVCFLTKENKILLGMKTKKIGAGCWNGYGGGVEKNETNEEAAIRELWEESGGVTTLPKHLEKIAIVSFHNTKSDGETFVCKVHFYLVHAWDGEIKESGEMIHPTWFNIHHLPFDEMMPADQYFLPLALSGQKITAEAHLGPFQKELFGKVKINPVKNFFGE